MDLSKFNSDNLFDAASALFDQLGIKVNSTTSTPIPISSIIKDRKTDTGILASVEKAYFLGIVNDESLSNDMFSQKLSFTEAEKVITDKYKGIILFALEISSLDPTRTELSDLIRVFNQASKSLPVTLVVKYRGKIAFITCERNAYRQTWRSGEKTGKVVLLKGIDAAKPNAAHLKILNDLSIARQPHIKSFDDLHKYWRSVFSIQTLNDQFYADLQKWFYWATKEIKLPFCHSYTTKEDNVKNFIVRLLARTMFCWFVKEKGLIRNELLELTDWQGTKYELTEDINEDDFLKSNSYYRGVLQNIFFRALNKAEKKSKKDFEGTRYLHSSFDYNWLVKIPYLNGGIFDELLEDNARDSNDDSVINIPNFLFYGITKKETVSVGRGTRATTERRTVHHKGLNEIFREYKFTLEENTPFEEDIALDPELLGLVFENLLAELDPNLEESTIKSIRKLTGSYYTPRKIIQEMVDESLFLYVLKFIQANYDEIENPRQQIADLIYRGIAIEDRKLREAIVNALDKFRVLDPACGSGAFPMGVLHRMVDLLKLVDSDNGLWLGLKLENVDPAQRGEFKKVLTNHLDDYSRKLGIIRDSIYGIDIQPLAVQITKLRFFISLLIDQNTAKGITPMPNIETKIICADTLKDIQPDLFSYDAIERLKAERIAYYRPDLTHNERDEIAERIADILDGAFPAFSREVIGKNIEGQNRVLLREWFTHATIAAPFFNMDFFYPELKDVGGFDCVIGNPPYGGSKLSDDVRAALGIESKDPYGAFIARFLNRLDVVTPLKSGGVLALIVSDTFMTIKSHLPLRRHLMQNYVHKMIRVHPDTFRATVNTTIIVCERNSESKLEEKHICQMADMTNISIHENYDRFVEVLEETKGILFVAGKTDVGNDEYAIYYYPQSLIQSNSSLPFFVASPNLFTLVADRSSVASPAGSVARTSYPVSFNGQEFSLYKLGETYSGSGRTKTWRQDGLVKVISGIKTGSNQKYLRIVSGDAQRSFAEVDRKLVLTNTEIENLTEAEMKDGIRGPKSFVRFEMGLGSDSDSGILPCYNQEQSHIVIDWSLKGVAGMRAEGHSDLANHEFRFQNTESQISFSPTGFYAPTFRIANTPIFLNHSSRMFLPSQISRNDLLGLLNSKLFRYFLKTYINHSVVLEIDDLKRVLCKTNHELADLVANILESQAQELDYDYASHEQIEIDRLVYEAYGLNADDVIEVENWYARRYPKLSAAQKKNLRDLGKSDDYLELYGLK